MAGLCVERLFRNLRNSMSMSSGPIPVFPVATVEMQVLEKDKANEYEDLCSAVGEALHKLNNGMYAFVKFEIQVWIRENLKVVQDTEANHTTILRNYMRVRAQCEPEAGHLPQK